MIGLALCKGIGHGAAKKVTDRKQLPPPCYFRLLIGNIAAANATVW
jgi:hypothetical protein